MRLFAWVAIALAGCGAGEQGPTFFPTGFRPGPPLGEPPPPDPSAPGVDYTVEVAPRFAVPWRAFLDDLRLRLPPDHRLNRSSLAVRVGLEIDVDGSLVAMRVVSPSGDRAFDDAALEVAREALPLPRPPMALLSDDERLHLEWQFARDVRQAGPATARIRRVEWPLERALPALLSRGRVGEAARRIASAAESIGESDGAQQVLIDRFREVCSAAVIQALTSDETSRQAAGVAAAAAAGLTAAAPALRKVAGGSIDPAVRRAAMRALGQLGDRAALPLLRQVALGEAGLSSEDIGAAAAALHAMKQDGDVRAAASKRLRSDSELDRWTALAVMTQVPVPEAVPDLVAFLRGDGRVVRAERITAAAALGAVAAQPGESARPALEALVDCLGVADAAQRAACAQAIAGAARAGEGGRPIVTRLLALLRDRDEGVRAAATLAAARLDPDRFAGSLPRLSGERSELVLASLAEGLAGVPGPRALSRLIRLAASKSPRVRSTAAASLARRTEPRAVETLARLTEHRDLAVRMVAVRADRRPAELRAALRDDEPEVAAAALGALVALEGRWRTLPEAAELLAALPASSSERALTARAWLAP
jgi:TonB family protein